MKCFGLFPENRHPRLDIRGLQFGCQTALEAGNKPLLQIVNLARRTITRKHDLLAPIEERIKGVEELFLGTFFAGQEMYIIDQENIGLAVALSKSDQHIMLDRVDELVGESFTGKVHHLL